MKRSWKLIIDNPRNGFKNMATDETLLTKIFAEDGTPIFRIYRWDKPTISLGRFQNPEDALFLDRCKMDNIPIVRRITGGAVILHLPEEITYSLVCSDADIDKNLSVKETYRAICRFLLNFYTKLGFQPKYAVENSDLGESLGLRTSLCFAGKEEYDITINGKKIGGNAQKRLKHTIFQHGSIPIKFDCDIIKNYVKNIPDDIKLKSTSLRELGVTKSIDELTSILKDSFLETINCSFREYVMSDSDKDFMNSVRKKKYESDIWSFRGENVEY
ncbi:MAG TPA: lipoate--protein ligase family protein [Spirochaetota bacterium]|nr:MAG: Octanoyltransferase LipM [Spirochaetes bacterium ADurb.Bin133]HNZ26904.1 lipoate--protein ligase family protein [Spirochaetota bacterium]HPY87125.1 lipoate--protein ligase family protein [Spirochaetota bacterium]HQB60092.1 lipoate--protein ligase family protein [Spirochaetota bacterium]